jgi:hypothetical protein
MIVREKMRDKTNLKSLAEEQDDVVLAGKLTFSQVVEGRYGAPEARSVLVTFAARSA